MLRTDGEDWNQILAPKAIQTPFTLQSIQLQTVVRSTAFPCWRPFGGVSFRLVLWFCFCAKVSSTAGFIAAVHSLPAAQCCNEKAIHHAPGALISHKRLAFRKGDSPLFRNGFGFIERLCLEIQANGHKKWKKKTNHKRLVPHCALHCQL